MLQLACSCTVLAGFCLLACLVMLFSNIFNIFFMTDIFNLCNDFSMTISSLIISVHSNVILYLVWFQDHCQALSPWKILQMWVSKAEISWRFCFSRNLKIIRTLQNISYSAVEHLNFEINFICTSFFSLYICILKVSQFMS